jgi:DNA-binding Xre family transcriptional regulator
VNPIQTMQEIVGKSFPKAKFAMDSPQSERGSWFLDIKLDDYWLNVEWKAEHGFGLISRDDVVYAEQADEIYPDLNGAARRVLWLLEHKSKTSPRLSDQLRTIRLKRHLTQEDIADRLGIQQSSVSRLEGRGETIGLRKLQELIAAMGGQLSLRVVFPESGEVNELSLGELRTGTFG